MNFATMLQSASVVRKPRRVPISIIFAELGGKAGTKTLVEKSGTSKQAVTAKLHRMEERGLVRRVGTILRPGKGRSEIIWEWVL